ncbi:hypothetical protein DUNSADRAFT_5769 [Dunaliella salina]|uniref:Encoded protein n=1 Tax=Dunaliella salina TaxID=3046 RepID=A0ABQ7H767_DUNSA|nr:hypothetical protein DUNSADRAFT_5769 [Dunaliella salina]|eukprot:KAF5842693.1 hypothetical protein DUNSADRAFT_5769 [Dunaliella salina]
MVTSGRAAGCCACAVTCPGKRRHAVSEACLKKKKKKLVACRFLSFFFGYDQEGEETLSKSQPPYTFAPAAGSHSFSLPTVGCLLFLWSEKICFLFAGLVHLWLATFTRRIMTIYLATEYTTA